MHHLDYVLCYVFVRWKRCENSKTSFVFYKRQKVIWNKGEKKVAGFSFLSELFHCSAAFQLASGQRLKQPPLGVDTETCLSICHTCPLHENSWFCKELTECFLDICSESRQKALEAAEMKRERESERCLRWFGQPALLNSSSACLKSSFIFI